MPPSPSRSQIDALGRRLARAATPSADDLALLARIQSEYEAVLGRVVAAMTGVFGEELGRRSKSLALTSRVKTAPTLRDKLRRGSALSSIQDVVGVRVVGDISLTEQDDLTSRSTRLFPEHRVVDRRVSPMHGYRAVHVIAKVDGFPVEIQIRTVWQHVWAEATEKLADAGGEASGTAFHLWATTSRR